MSVVLSMLGGALEMRCSGSQTTSVDKRVGGVSFDLVRLVKQKWGRRSVIEVFGLPYFVQQGPKS